MSGSHPEAVIQIAASHSVATRRIRRRVAAGPAGVAMLGPRTPTSPPECPAPERFQPGPDPTPGVTRPAARDAWEDRSEDGPKPQKAQLGDLQFGSVPVRISLSINPHHSSTYRRPVRNRPPPGSAWDRFRQFGRRATGKGVTILQLSVAIAKRAWSS